MYSTSNASKLVAACGCIYWATAQFVLKVALVFASMVRGLV